MVQIITKKIIEPLIKRRDKVYANLLRLTCLSLGFGAVCATTSYFYNGKHDGKITKAQKLELNIKKNKVAMPDRPIVERQIFELKNKATKDKTIVDAFAQQFSPNSNIYSPAIAILAHSVSLLYAEWINVGIECLPKWLAP